MTRLRLTQMCIPLAMGLGACGMPESQTESAIQKLSSSTDLAITWLGVAETNAPTNTVSDRISDVSDALDTRQIILDEKNDGGPCSDNTEDEFTLAYIPPPLSTSSIHVCQEAMDFDKAIIAQTLIHEGIHATGNTSECGTTEQELQYMTLAGEQPFKNVYVDDPSCASYDLGDGIDFIVLDDGFGTPVPVAVPRVRDWRTHDAPHGARYTRMRRTPPTLLVSILGRESTTWLSNIFPFLSR